MLLYASLRTVKVKFALSLILLFIAVFTAEARPRRRIINGHEVRDIRNLPWMAHLNIGCSASIIGRRKILTAGHCTCGIAAANLKIMTGSTNIWDSKARRYQIIRKYEHPTYLAQRNCDLVRADDITILETATDIKFDDKAQPIKVEFNRIADMTEVTNMGFGSDGEAYGKLKFANNKAWNCQYEGMMLCTSTKNSSSYYEDSGGPIVTCADEQQPCRQIGVNSGFGDHICTYTSTYVQRSFIKRHM